MRFQSRLAGLLALLMVAGAGSALAQGETGSDAAADPAETACDLGDGSACLALGERLFLGQGSAADGTRALDLFGRACDLDVAQACFRLGAEREFPDFGMPDADAALEAYTRACTLGLEAGCDRAGLEPATAPEAEKLPPSALTEAPSRDAPVIVTAPAPPTEESFIEEALLADFASEALPDLDFGQPADGEEFSRATEDEAALAQKMAEAPAEPSEEALLAEERQNMAEACGRGEMEACEMFAAWLRDGTGGAADAVRARRIFSVICTEGSVRGCYELGWMMFDAGRVPEASPLELSRARFLFTETCKAGVIEACLQAGDMLRDGIGGRLDRTGAGRVYTLACEAGLEPACTLAAEMAPLPEEAAPEDEAEAAPQDDLPTDGIAPAPDETISD